MYISDIISEKVIIGAGTLVSKDLESNGVYSETLLKKDTFDEVLRNYSFVKHNPIILKRKRMWLGNSSKVIEKVSNRS